VILVVYHKYYYFCNIYLVKVISRKKKLTCIARILAARGGDGKVKPLVSRRELMRFENSCLASCLVAQSNQIDRNLEGRGANPQCNPSRALLFPLLKTSVSS